MARIKYYYDTEKCKFEKATPTWSSITKKVLSYLLVSGVLSGFMIFYMFYMHDNPVTNSLKQKNKKLLEYIENFHTEIEGLEEKLNELHRVDAQVYRTILNAEPLTEEIWRGGTGGNTNIRYKELEPEALQATRARLQKMAAKVNIQHKSYSEILQRFKEREEELKHIPSIRPVKGGVISGFGMRFHPILKYRKMHTGLDFQAPMGTPIYATADGVIKTAGRSQGGYGVNINIDHGYGYESKYAHLSKLRVKAGQKVKRGDMIGLTGNSGLSKGPHLHYEILKDGKKIDPIDYFYSDLSPETYVDFKRKAKQFNESMD